MKNAHGLVCHRFDHIVLREGRDLKRAILRVIGITAMFCANAGLADARNPAQIPPPAIVTPPPVAMPSREVLAALIRMALDALNQANITNNYSVLSRLGSDSFIANNPPERLSQVFEPLRRGGVSLISVLIVGPQLDRPATINQNILHLIGHFETQPQIIHYDIAFEGSRGSWRISAVNVTLTAANSGVSAALKP